MSTFFEIGMMIGGYRVMRALAKGGMGCVYEVEHEKLGVRYALKTFTLDRGCAVDLLRQRFLVEGKVLARMRHPNLVRVYDLGIDEATKTPYFVMDLILDKAGRSLTLDDIRPGKVDESTLVRWFGELASALDYIHEKGIVHRDIKTSNILVDEFGSVMLADFGISRYIGDDLRAQLDVKSKLGADGRPLESTMQLVLGTRAFMAPEVKAGRAATAASDAYSLGLVFFWILTGVWPTGKIGQFDMLKGFEHDWWGVLPWLLNEAPHLRPPTLTETARMLKACRQESAVRTEPDVVRLSAEAANDKLWIRDWMPFLRKSAAVGVALGVAVGVYMATTRYPMILDAGVIGIAAVAVCALFGIVPGSRTEGTIPAGEKFGAPSRPAPAHRPVAMLDCPYCGGPMQLETELEDGRRVRCPHCNGKSVYEASRRVLTELRPPEPIRVPPEAIVERRRERVPVTSSKPTAKAERPNRDDRSRLQRIPSVAYGFQR